MKILDIAFRDLKHTALSVFSLIMMFGAPLLITGLLYFAFGSLATDNTGFDLPVTKVAVANLDQPNAQSTGFAAGEMLIEFLKDESLSGVLAVSLAGSEAEARAAVDGQAAGVALVIPPGFTAAVAASGSTAAVTLYQDPTLTIGPGIVKDLIRHFLDGFSGAKIAGETAASMLGAHGVPGDPNVAHEAAQQYVAWLQAGEHDQARGIPRLSIVSPTGTVRSSGPRTMDMGPIMAGMVVFFVFFIGANGAQSIIREAEEGTLSRLLTTPTPVAAILGGKFLGVVAALVLQVLVLLLAAVLLFRMSWGQPATVVLVATGLVAAAAGFGVMLMSFIKNSRQTGPVLGGVMTLTGMLGGLFTTGLPNPPAALDKVTLITPQGWALQGWKLALAGAGPREVLIPVLVMVLMGAVFVAVGAALFRRRFA